MKRKLLFLCVIAFLVVCSEKGTQVTKHQPKHDVEKIVLKFVTEVKQDVFKENPYFFEADTEFTTEERVHYFRRLEKYLKNNNWDLHYTIIDIYDGYEDLADVILKAQSGDLVVFCLAYWYDTQRWELDAYEFPVLTFDRPADQSYEDYVLQIIEEAKEVGVSYAEKGSIEDFGTYYIEYK